MTPEALAGFLGSFFGVGEARSPMRAGPSYLGVLGPEDMLELLDGLSAREGANRAAFDGRMAEFGRDDRVVVDDLVRGVGDRMWVFGLGRGAQQVAAAARPVIHGVQRVRHHSDPQRFVKWPERLSRPDPEAVWRFPHQAFVAGGGVGDTMRSFLDSWSGESGVVGSGGR